MNGQKEIKFEIVEEICTLSESPNGWTKQLNLVSWNGSKPKYDIREWSDDRQRMSKGITLTEDEMSKIVEVVKNR